MNRVDWYGPNVWAWNPLAMLCTPVSHGCDYCWHLRVAPRLAGNKRFTVDERAAWRGDGAPIIRPDELDAPCRRRKPSVIAVQFMGDLFHEDLTDQKIDSVFNTICDTPQHTYLLLTKRPDYMAEYLTRCRPKYFNHVWAGISVSTQLDVDRFLSDLLLCPAAKRWLSIEPMLGPIHINHSVLTGRGGKSRIDWIVVGAETGPKTRPLHPDWVCAVRDTCIKDGVPFYLKQIDQSGRRKLDGQTWDQTPWGKAARR